MTHGCPACSSAELEGFYELKSIPSNSCLLVEDVDEARAFPVGDVDLALCARCGFITNRAFSSELAEYSSRYEETQAFSPRFVEFGHELARTWVDRHELRDKHVLEIGCGKGEFLLWMLEAGVRSGTGIDPGVQPARLDPSLAHRVQWIRDRYDERYRDLEADAVVCRHTLEHIAPVREFLRGLREHLEGTTTPVLFELPDTQRVLEEAAFWDVYYEHCSYFTSATLRSLFEHSGFEVERVERVYEDQYLLIEAYPTQLPRNPVAEPGIVNDLRAAARRFSRDVDQLRARWRQRVAHLAQQGSRIALWGGGSKAVAFLTTLGLGEEIGAVVDINPYKQGRFIAGTGHEVIAPDRLADLDPRLIIVMNPVYLDEVRADLDQLGIVAEVTAL